MAKNLEQFPNEMPAQASNGKKKRKPPLPGRLPSSMAGTAKNRTHRAGSIMSPMRDVSNPLGRINL